MMSTINQEIGARIRGIRELNEVSVDALAEQINTSPAQLSAYEKGEADIPISVLHDISGAFGIGFTELLTGEKARLSQYSVVRKGKGVRVDRYSAYNYEALAYNFTERNMEPFVVTLEPKPEGEPFSLTSHGGQEFHFCLEGSFRVKIDRHEVDIHEGDALYFNSKYLHGLKALDGKSAKVLVVVGG